MPRPNEFHPIILFSPDSIRIYDALVAAGHQALSSLIAAKASRSDTDRRTIAAVPALDENVFDFDDVPIVSEGEDGAYVSCWVWVPKADVEVVAGETKEDESAVEKAPPDDTNRRCRLDRHLAGLQSHEKDELLRVLAEVLYGPDLDPHTEWDQGTIEQIADQMDVWLRLSPTSSCFATTAKSPATVPDRRHTTSTVSFTFPQNRGIYTAYWNSNGG